MNRPSFKFHLLSDELVDFIFCGVFRRFIQCKAEPQPSLGYLRLLKNYPFTRMLSIFSLFYLCCCWLTGVTAFCSRAFPVVGRHGLFAELSGNTGALLLGF